MKNLQSSLRKGLRWASISALAFGLPLATSLHAQNSSYNNNYNYNNARKPKYSGKSWTDHLVLEGGAGGTVGADKQTQNQANPGFNALLGAGFKFNNRLSLLGEWNFNDMGVPHSVANSVAQVPGGNEHIWTATLDPKFNFIRKGRFDGYAIGGGGFSRVLTSFTQPVLIPCGYGYGYGGYGYGYGGGGCTGNITVSHHSSNQATLNIGVGGEFRFSEYSRTKLFIEARYLKVMTPKNSLPPGYNASFVPMTIGVRW